MNLVRLAFLGMFWLAFCGASVTKGQTTPQPATQPTINQPTAPASAPVSAQQQTPSPTPPAAPAASDLGKLAAKVQPAVVLVTVFDATGKLLRTGTGFFVSDTGRIITTMHTMDGAVNAVAKTGDDGIYNVTGVQASSSKLDLAVLNAEVKQVPFLNLNKSVKLEPEMPVAIIGCSLAGKDGAPLGGTISNKEIDEDTNKLDLKAAVPEASFGAPVVDPNGEVIGIVTGRDGQDQASVVARPVNILESVIEDVKSDTAARWPGEPRPSPTPRARIVYAPPLTYPSGARFRDRGPHTGRYRVSFDARGTVKSIQVLQSTGSELLDRAAIGGLQQWKSEPGREGYVIVPLTFQTR